MEYDETKEEEFEEIYRTYKDDIYRISLYYTKDEHIAQDISQNVFYQFYFHINDVKAECVRAYLIRSARNMSYNWLRSVSRDVGGEYLDTIPEENVPHYSTEEEYIRDEEKREIIEFTKELMERLREHNESWYDIVNLLYCLGKTREMVADELDISRELLYDKLYRAKQWLRKNFEDEYRNL